MNEDEEKEESGESLDEIEQERDFLVYENLFLKNAILAAAKIAAPMESQEFIQQMYVHGIQSGLELGIFRPDGEFAMPPDLSEEDRAELEENWDVLIPWSAVVDIAAEEGIDAVEVKNVHLDHLRGQLEQMERMIDPGVLLDDIAEVIQNFAETLYGARVGSWEKRSRGKPVLHCAHNDHSCEHWFDNMSDLYEVAAMELASGELQSVSHVTVDDVTVMEHDQLMTNIDLIRNAGNN